MNCDELVSSIHVDGFWCCTLLTEIAEENGEDAGGEEDGDDLEDGDSEEESGSESEWEEVKDGEEIDTGDAEDAAEEEKSDEDSDSERLSSGTNAGTCEEYDKFPFIFFSNEKE